MTATATTLPPTEHRWTREEYYRIFNTGLFEGRRVELIDGRVIDMCPQNNPHARAISLINRILTREFDEKQWEIVVQSPLALTDEDEPEPDFAVVRGDPRSRTDHPDTAELVIEVANASRAFDLKDKASLYARQRIADYWVLDLPKQQLVVHRDPIADTDARFGWAYASVTTHTADQTVAPLALQSASIRVADMLP